MKPIQPIQNDLILLGGGHAHLTVLRAFTMKPHPGTRITLINQTYDTPYSGMIPGHIAGHYTHQQTHINLHHLTQHAQAQLYIDTITHIDTQQQHIHTQNHPPIHYDLLSINTGSTPHTQTIPGAQQHATPIKPIHQFLKKWQHIQHQLTQPTPNPHQLKILGAGPAAIEIALNIRHHLNTHTQNHNPKPHTQITLLTPTPTILPNHHKNTRHQLQKTLQQHNIQTKTNWQTTKIDNTHIHNQHQQKTPYHHLLALTHAAPPPWIKQTNLPTNQHGFITINQHLQTTTHPNIFAAGDIATNPNQPHPKSGVYAVRQGPHLAQNLRNTLLQKPLTTYKPQKHTLNIITTGPKHAIATKGPLTLKGKTIWHWKNHIDQKFIQKHQNPPKMKHPPKPTKPTKTKTKNQTNNQTDPTPYNPIRCHGCASKTPQQTLNQTLNQILNQIPQNPTIPIGLHQPDDAALITLPPNTQLAQTTDHLPAFINNPHLFARIAINHALTDILALGATPHSAQLTITLPYAHPKPTQTTLHQTITGALRTLNQHNTTLIGGHTLEAEQLTLGATINGTLHKNTPPLRKNQLKPNQTLILTKPLGTGILLAAAMRTYGPSHWLQNALQHMLQSNQPTIPILRQHHIQAATDITGFGLIGHLLEMLQTSHTNATINPQQIPLLTGVTQTLQNNIHTSLHHQNQQNQKHIPNHKQHQHTPHYQTLFDPQTSGGLLIAVPQNKQNTILNQIKQTGHTHAAIIGTTTPPTTNQPQIHLTNQPTP